MRVATPLGLSCTLLPSCFTFFSLCSFRLYLDSVWFASARQRSDLERSSLSLPLSLSLWLSPFRRASRLFSLSRRDHGAPQLSATRVYIGPGWWGPRQNDEQVKVSPVCLSLCSGRRHVSSIAGEEERGTEGLGTNTRRVQGSPHRKARSTETWVHRG